MRGSTVKSHDWPQMGKVLSARQTTLYLLSFQGYLLILPPESLGPEAPQSLETGLQQAHLQIQYSSEVTNWPPGDWGRNPWGMTRRMRTTRWQISPLWLEDFTDNPEPTEVHAPAHISEHSDSERPMKVATKQRKHCIEKHFPKDRNCDVCLRTKIPKGSCRRRIGEALPRPEKFGDLITADHKILDEGGESGENHRYAVVVQDLATQWIQSYPCKTKSSHETEKTCKNSRSRRKHRKL